MKEFLKKYQDKWIVFATRAGWIPPVSWKKIDDDRVSLRFERHAASSLLVIQLSEIEGVFVNPKNWTTPKRIGLDIAFAF